MYFPTFKLFLQCLEAAMSKVMVAQLQFGLKELCNPILILFVVRRGKIKGERALLLDLLLFKECKLYPLVTRA